MTNSSINSICIVRLSALGDVLMLVPLIRTLQFHFPETKLTWVISRPAYDLVSSIDNVEFIVIDKPNNLADYWRFKQQMRSRRFDVLLAVQSSFRANLLYSCIKAKRKIGFDSLRAKDCHKWFINEAINPGKDHTLDGFLRFAEALGIQEKKISWDLLISDEDYSWAKKNLPQKSSRPIVLVNPAASKPERSWTIDGYIEVIKYAKQNLDAEVVLIGGPNKHDLELGDAISAEISVTNIIGKTKLTQLLAVISLSDVLICPDTGPSHMSAAVSTPVVALHAVTSANVSGPYIYKHLSVDCYDEAVSVILHKTLDTNVWGTHAHGMSTMQLVKAPMVIEKLELALQAN
jgi:heptosyltransferase I